MEICSTKGPQLYQNRAMVLHECFCRCRQVSHVLEKSQNQCVELRLYLFWFILSTQENIPFTILHTTVKYHPLHEYNYAGISVKWYCINSPIIFSMSNCSKYIIVYYRHISIPWEHFIIVCLQSMKLIVKWKDVINSPKLSGFYLNIRLARPAVAMSH